MTDLPIKGGPELLAFFDAFPQKIQNGAARAGLVAAARPVRDEARRLARKKSGKMAKAIKTGSPRVNQDGTVSVRVRLDPKSDHAFLGIFHEYGVAPHLISVATQITPAVQKRDGRIVPVSIKTVNKRIKSGGLRIGDNFVGPMVSHPGHSAHPFMRPALDTRATDAINAFGERTRSYLKDKTSFTAPVTIEADIDE